MMEAWGISLWGWAESPGALQPGEGRGGADQCLSISKGQESSRQGHAVFSRALQ